MFKGILPSSKRIVSSEFTMITPLMDATTNGKENHPDPTIFSGLSKPTKPPTTKTKSFGLTSEKKRNSQSKGLEPPVEAVVTNQAFNKLLDDLQIPSTLRPKLATMDATVKAAMLKSSQTMALNPPPSPPLRPRAVILRKTRSSESLGSPKPLKSSAEYDSSQLPLPAGIVPGVVSAHHASSLGAPHSPSGHSRGVSFDGPRTFSRTQVSSVMPSEFVPGKSTKEKGTVVAKNISPTKFFSILSGTSSTELDIESVKKLRLLLRNESASWSQEFLKLGGYAALLTRLNEILEIEWREEQHDDQILHELLRCFKALSTSAIGCFALRSSCPTPFVQLVALLYSDKKPGDVATRQLIVDLLLILFELYPPSSLPSEGSASGSRTGPRREVWDTRPASPSPSNLITLPTPHKTVFSLIRALLLTPAPPPSESPATPISPHAFIESLHRPRIYKTYLRELSDVCRDYFWVFCHPNNTIWVLRETDEGCAEKPRAPGGMTGGVEFEAIGYFTTHLKLINAIASTAQRLDLPKDHDHSAHRFHSDLFLSGLERIILISRKASTAYYPTLHLELARYIALAGAAGYELPWTVSRLIGMPPTAMCKIPSTRGTSGAAPGGTTPKSGSPVKRSNGPGLPSPVKFEPMRFE